MKTIKNMRLRRFIAKYIRYLEILAYAFVLLVGGGVVAAWSWKVDVTARSKDGDLKPFQHEVQTELECVVIDVLVEDESNVVADQVIAVVCTDPAWIARVKLLDEVRGLHGILYPPPPEEEQSPPEKQDEKPEEAPEEDGEESPAPPPIPTGFDSLGMLVESALPSWEAAKPPTTVELKSPAAGMVTLGQCAAGAIIKADKKVFGVKDFSRLRAKLSFEAKNVEACRPGLKGYVDVKTSQSFETLFRLNSDSRPGLPYFGSRLDPFSRLAPEEIRAKLTEGVLEKGYVDRDKELQGDFALPATDIDNVTLRIMAQRHVLEETSMDPAIQSENYRMEKLSAVVAEGTHAAGFTLLRVAPELQRDIEGMVAELLLDRRIKSNDEIFTLDKGVDEVVINLSVKSEQEMDVWDLETHPKGVDPEFFGDGVELEKKGSPDVKRTSRKFSGVLELVEPPAELQALVRELALEGKSLKVTGEIITGKTRFAMLLFRKH
ncbi:MAG: hypothetical protein HN742_37655 [Lentisphaerae bacterium]|nr:hypothetical protein [Lentisphaerota bacterium]MBT4820208.1 hypothetical protein [Lentisphaerota bacterium]MBT7058715.1 hypothetical protein [Lentisphaerota bacterium]MBT7847655.1 hypothetical protein [Lentisphaerota bacterium]